YNSTTAPAPPSAGGFSILPPGGVAATSGEGFSLPPGPTFGSVLPWPKGDAAVVQHVEEVLRERSFEQLFSGTGSVDPFHQGEGGQLLHDNLHARVDPSMNVLHPGHPNR
ncbi:unnamed protein product, partial [Amoebophrya sp. A25]